MNMDTKSSISYINKFKNQIKQIKNTEIVICPPFTLLSKLNESIKNTKIKLGAQNLHFEEQGAYTGEISASMLKDVGCSYVILGHSERRQYFKETDNIINKKIKIALKNKLKVILCVGETLQQRNSNQTTKIIKNQLVRCLKNIKDMKNIVIAYEPIWAIGTGKNATPQQSEDVHKFIRNSLKNKSIRIIYGGSMKPDNAKELLSMPNIDGGLVGGASLDPKSFTKICNV